MPKVICTLPNASEEISGVKFTPHPNGGMVSEEIDQAQADRFASIPGYQLVRRSVKASVPAPAAPSATDDETKEQDGAVDDDANPSDELEQMRARAAELGIKVSGRWGVQRLAAEIKAADDKAAATNL